MALRAALRNQRRVRCVRSMCSVTVKPWEESLPDEKFQFLKNILAAPSPVGLEGAMTHGVLEPAFKEFIPSSWAVHRFKGSAGIVVDTLPEATGDDKPLTVMIIGHADKIRMQVRSIGSDGKIWINSDSFLPLTLIGNEVTMFSEKEGQYRKISGGTVEALGAIHFASAQHRSGSKGITSDQLYLDLQLHGKKRKEQVEALGIRPGDSIILDRPIKKGFSKDTFYGAYLDNGLGCYVTTEVARLVAEHAGGLPGVRCLFTIAAYEEIGRFGSRVMVGEMKPDVVIGVDVNHDYDFAPGVGDKRFPPLTMGAGATMSVGAIVSEKLNTTIESVATEHGIPLQRDMVGRDTGTDAMAGVLASVDTAATSIGFPIRNMHTISESGHTGDLQAAVHLIYRTLERFNNSGPMVGDDFKNGHPRLDLAESSGPVELPSEKKAEDI